MWRIPGFFGWAFGVLAFPIVVSAVSLRIIRPEPAESLALPIGYTFVVGTVQPADSKVTCNGEECDVDEDGAFLGFVPIRVTGKPWKQR